MHQSGHELPNSQATADLSPDEFAQFMAESETIEAAVQAGVRDSLIVHKRLGHPIVVWEDGQVVWIPAEDIEIPEEEPGEESPD
jgi:hypothetical protein